MRDYKTLKHSDNGMPTWDSFLGLVLQIASTKRLWKKQDLIDATIKEIRLPEKLATLRYPSKYHELIAQNRVGWAISDLKVSGLLDNPKRGYYQITELGKKILDEKGIDITREFIHSLPKYVQHRENKNIQNKDKSDDDLDSLELTSSQIENWFNKQKDDLADLLLTKLRKTNPYVFEHMMIELMTRMGYKGADGEAFVTQKSNDGGIDGILNQDALGLRKIYVQVKRYAEDNTVGRQTISQFHGDLDLQGAGSGVFITTSSFTRSAEEAGKKFNIRLIDGEALTKLMIEYKVGVQVQDTFEQLEIDNDFFERKDR